MSIYLDILGRVEKERRAAPLPPQKRSREERSAASVAVAPEKGGPKPARYLSLPDSHPGISEAPEKAASRSAPERPELPAATVSRERESPPPAELLQEVERAADEGAAGVPSSFGPQERSPDADPDALLKARLQALLERPDGPPVVRLKGVTYSEPRKAIERWLQELEEGPQLLRELARYHAGNYLQAAGEGASETPSFKPEEESPVADPDAELKARVRELAESSGKLPRYSGRYITVIEPRSFLLVNLQELENGPAWERDAARLRLREYLQALERLQAAREADSKGEAAMQ